MKTQFWLWVVVVSWGIAFFEYLLQVPANRIGSATFSLGQLKKKKNFAVKSSLWESSVPFAVLYMGQTLKAGLTSGRGCVWSGRRISSFDLIELEREGVAAARVW